MAEENVMIVTADWVKELQFTAIGEASGMQATLDVRHPDDSPRQGPSPMEMLLMSLAGCTGMDVISILVKKRQQVKSLRLNVTGERNPEFPKEYTRIHIEFVVKGNDISPEAVERSIWLSQNKYCSVTASIKAEVVTSFKIEQEAGFTNA